jgi:hypothetical protein
MYQRIIETAPTFPDVLLIISDTSGEVEIYACGNIDGIINIISEKVQFENLKSACNYINDFSLKSANNWCEQNEITYNEQ